MAEPKEPLTERELEVVRLVGTGAGNKEIAAQLSLSPNTVKVHLRNIFTKLEAQSRTEVTMMAMRNGWITLAQATADGPADVVAHAPSLPSNGARVESLATPGIEPVELSPAIVADSPAHAGGSPTQPVAIAPLVVPVAPNPQPLPLLPPWRRLAIPFALALALVLMVVSAPVTRGTAAGSIDPLRINPNQTRSVFLMRGEVSRWHLLSPLPAARARSAAVAVNGRIYVLGGEVDETVSGDIIVFDPGTNAWTPLDAPKPTPVANAAAASENGRIYIAGGTTASGDATASVEAFDTSRRTWMALPSLDQPVAGHAFAAHNGQLFLFGGATNQGNTADSYRFDIAQGAWHPIAAMPTRRSLAMAAVMGNRIYVVGGYDESRELAVCEYYEPAKNSWGKCASMTVPRSGLGLVGVGQNLFAIGGGATGFIGFNERYDPSGDRWTALETPVTGDWQSIAVAAGATEFYVFGGYSSGSRLAFGYVYEVFIRRVFVPAFQSQSGADKGIKP